MKKDKRKAITILLLFFGTCLIAQNEPVVKMEMAKDNEPVKNNISNSIKLNPLLFFRGDIPIYYENNMMDHFGLEIGFGITLKDYLSSVNTNIYDVTGINISANTSIKTGYSYTIGIRYYASDYSFQPEGLYFQIKYRHQTYNSVLLSVDGIQAKNEKLIHTNKDFGLDVGYVEGFAENAFIEPYIGFGLRNRDFDEVIGTSIGSISIYTVGHQEDIIPFLSLGIKVGILF